MRPRKCQPPSPACDLPVDVLLEIALRAGFVTLLRFGATCKFLRRAVRSPDLGRRVRSSGDNREGILFPSRLLGFLDDAMRTLSLADPATPAAASLVENHHAPFVPRGAADLLAKYKPLVSRGGLLLLEREFIAHHIKEDDSGLEHLIASMQPR